MFRPAVVLAIPLIALLPVGASAQSVTTSAKSQTANAPARVKGQRRAGYRAETATAPRSCGVFMYFKKGKCNDARDKK